MLKVAEKVVENDAYATLFFDHELAFTPGQFVMLWIPGLDEKPYTVSYHDAHQFAVTLEAKGVFSKRAVQLEKGDLIGIRGPFGNGFTIDTGKNIGIVAGGCGMATLATLIEKAYPRTGTDKTIVFIHGARSRDYLLYPQRFGIKRHFCTDDGSFGHKGFVTDILEDQINQGMQFDMIYACGPEIMMYNIFRLCEKYNLSCQMSMERYMRCGFGICGACVCGSRLVCIDGPVFDFDTLKTMDDFNKKALLKSGRDADLETYFAWRSQEIIS